MFLYVEDARPMTLCLIRFSIAWFVFLQCIVHGATQHGFLKFDDACGHNWDFKVFVVENNEGSPSVSA